MAVLSHAFWLRRFGGDPTVVGRWLTLEDKPLQIVGVAEPRFTGVEPGHPTDVWVPYAMYNPRAFGNPQFNWFRIVGRLNENVPLEQAQSVLQAAFTNFRREYAPQMSGPERSPERVARFLGTPLYVRSAANGVSPLRREFERSLWILSSIAALVLLIAGSNVANLFLARTVAREREMALRLSIGAGRGRLIQQMLVESAIVAGAACVLGLLFASAAAPAVVDMLASADDPVRLDLRMDWRLARVRRRTDAADDRVVRRRARPSRLERRAADRPQDRRPLRRPRRRDASVRRGAGRVRPGRAVRGQPAGPVVRQVVECEPGLRHVQRAVAAPGPCPARGREGAAHGPARSARSAPRRSRRAGGQLGRVQRGRPRVDPQRSRAGHTSSSGSKRRWRR